MLRSLHDKPVTILRTLPHAHIKGPAGQHYNSMDAHIYQHTPLLSRNRMEDWRNLLNHQTEAHSDKPLVLVIEDAHALGTEEQEFLQVLHHYAHAHLLVIYSGEPSPIYNN